MVDCLFVGFDVVGEVFLVVRELFLVVGEVCLVVGEVFLVVEAVCLVDALVVVPEVFFVENGLGIVILVDVSKVVVGKMGTKQSLKQPL